MSKLDEAIEIFGEGEWPPMLTALVEFAKEHRNCGTITEKNVRAAAEFDGLLGHDSWEDMDPDEQDWYRQLLEAAARG